MSVPDVSVVLCTYNRAGMLRETLRNIAAQQTGGEFSYEIVVVDDASTDATSAVIAEIARSSPARIRYTLGEGKGIGKARNRGVSESHGEWIAFTDDDQLAEASWLRELLSTALRTGADCVGGIMLLKLSHEKLSQMPLPCRACLRESVASSEARKRDGKNFLLTGNSLVKRRVFDHVGLFDESMTLGGEDLDLFRRIRKAGFKVWQTPEAVLHHLVPPYRLEKRYLRWNALRNGVCFAQVDLRAHGVLGAALLCIARIGKTLWVTLPRFCWACLRHDESQLLGESCCFAKMEGYIRKVLSIVGPRAFAQERFFAALEMRKESESFNTVAEEEDACPLDVRQEAVPEREHWTAGAPTER